MPASDATYRFELAKQGRALCQNTACKKAGVKIQKGEFRMGTLVDFQGNSSWRWKHWGCVTPLQIKNLQDQVGPLDDLDLDEDLPRIIDGYEDIDDEAHEKIKFALQNGHVPDEDWKGEPDLNRPGMKGINKRTPKKKAVEDDEDAGVENAETPTKPKPKPKRARAKKAEPESGDEEDVPAPKKKAAGKRKVKTEDDDDNEERAPPKRSRKRKASAKNEVEEQEVLEEQPVKRSRAKKVDDESEDEAVVTPAKRARAKKVKVEEREDEEVPDAPQADPVKRETVRKRKNAAVKAEVDEAEDVKPSIAQDDDQPPAPKRPGKSARGRKPKAEPVEDVVKGANVTAEEEGQGEDKVSLPAPDSTSAAVIKTDTDAGPALGDADLRPGVEEGDVGAGGVEADEAEENPKPAKAGRAKRVRKPTKGKAK